VNYWSALQAFYVKNFDFYSSGAMTCDGHWIAFENHFDCYHFQFICFMQGKTKKQAFCLEIGWRDKSIIIFGSDLLKLKLTPKCNTFLQEGTYFRVGRTPKSGL